MMPNTLISVRVKPELLAQAKKVAGKKGATVQELVRESLRDIIERQAINDLYGSGKGKTRTLSTAERERIARDYASELRKKHRQKF
jgi:antitoxin component of RelBE/YafQ-DinJ toxin-antitoxin module